MTFILILYVLVIGIASMAMTVAGFVAHQSTQQSITLFQLANSPLFSDENNNNNINNNSGDDDDNEFDGFNPFQPGAKIPIKGGFGILSDSDRKQPPPSSPGGQISPRQMKMKELTTDLLANISNEDVIQSILSSNEEFLLQQLNDMDAVLEMDSVYTPDMNRVERFVQYRKVMDSRIENARAPAAKKVLGLLREFVCSKEK